jgi:GT2 family glycosyltransferase
MSETPRLSLFITNYNTSQFVEVLVEAIGKLTKNTYEIIINDNGSNPAQLLRLTRLARTNPAINVHFRNSPEKHGGLAHGRALNELMPMARGNYGVVFDSDAVVLQKNWDEFLISKLNDKVKIAGTPLGEAWAGGKATDFP